MPGALQPGQEGTRSRADKIGLAEKPDAGSLRGSDAYRATSTLAAAPAMVPTSDLKLKEAEPSVESLVRATPPPAPTPAPVAVTVAPLSPAATVPPPPALIMPQPQPALRVTVTPAPAEVATKANESEARLRLMQRAPAPAPHEAQAPGFGEPAAALPDATTLAKSMKPQGYFRNQDSNVSRGRAAAPERRFNAPRPDPSGRAAAANQVLATFAVEQEGSKVRMIDADGSVYDGHIVAAKREKDAAAGLALGTTTLQRSENLPTANALGAIGPATNSLSGQPGAQVEFEVTGTNETLRQPVVFTGTLYYTFSDTTSATSNPAGGASPPTATGLAGNAPAAAQGPAQPVTRPAGVAPLRYMISRDPVMDTRLQSVVSNSAGRAMQPQVLRRVLGRGQYGGTNEVQVDAVPAPR